MQRMLRTIPALLFAIAACAPKIDTRAAANELLERDRAWAKLAEEGKDVEAIVNVWSEDVRVVLPGEQVIVGRAAAKEMVKGSLAIPGFKITWTPDSAVVSSSGDLGYTWGANHLTAPDSAGHLVTTDGRYVTIWRKDADGAWRCVWDTFNSGPAHS